MKKAYSIRNPVSLFLLALALVCPSLLQAQAPDAANPPVTAPPGTNAPPQGEQRPFSPVSNDLIWPRVYTNNTVIISIYQPQIEKWEGQDLETRSAVAVRTPEAPAPIYGVFWMKSRADVDKASDIVTLSDTHVTSAKFPTVPHKEAEYLELIRSHVPATVQYVSLAHLESTFAIAEAVRKAQSYPVKNEPPRIIYTTTPSILVLVDGPPALRPIPDVPNIERVINTPALILRADDTFYLFASDHWYQSHEIEGPWSLADNVSPSIEAAKETVQKSQTVDVMPPGPEAVTTTPVVYVSTTPTELLETEGPPNLVPIEGTQLMEVKNTDDALFLYLGDQHYYFLVSGRWFKATSLSGPWAYVSSKDLPADMTRIPPDHPKANALVSISGTPQANEAVIANSIPQTATISRKEAKLQVDYDGQPKFERIDNTGLNYAINTQIPVIQAGPDAYYSVQNGVWFTSSSPEGPWEVATSVPAEIYSIPASSPMHYVTYARVYGATPDNVYVGYTPGYYGTVLSPDYTVVYGTGWYYPPYVGNYWVGWPYTYGFGACFAGGWNWGFGFGFSAGYPFGAWCNPWWGPFGWGWRHGINYNRVNCNNINAYQHGWGHAAHGYGYGRYGGGYGRYGGNPWQPAGGPHGASWSGRAFAPYSSRGSFGGRSAEFRGFSGRMVQQGGISRSPAFASRNNLFSDRGGNVYRFNAQGRNWQRNVGGQWRNVPPNQAGNLNREALRRSMGQQRFNMQQSPVGRNVVPGGPSGRFVAPQGSRSPGGFTGRTIPPGSPGAGRSMVGPGPGGTGGRTFTPSGPGPGRSISPGGFSGRGGMGGAPAGGRMGGAPAGGGRMGGAPAGGAPAGGGRGGGGGGGRR